MKTTHSIDEAALQKASLLLRALVHPLRLSILSYINGRKECNVHAMYNDMDIEQSVASQQLRILRNAELVLCERRGKFVYYQLNHDKIELIEAAIRSFL